MCLVRSCEPTQQATSTQTPHQHDILHRDGKASIKVSVLGNISHYRPYLGRRMSTYPHCSAGGFEQTQHEFYERRLAATIWPDYGNHLPAVNSYIDIMQHLVAFIGKVEVLDLNGSDTTGHIAQCKLLSGWRQRF